MKFGRFEVRTINFGFFRLDGGAMFGAVPKAIWNKKLEADPENRILMATRSLLIQDGKRVILVDVGLGDKYSEKFDKIYAVQPLKTDIEVSSVTDIIVSHLHFDHSGGLSRRTADAKTEPVFPNANIYVQKRNLETAERPSLRERASYLQENYEVLKSPALKLVEGDMELFSDIMVHVSNGHTPGQQWVEVRDGQRSLVYVSDVIPTSHHLPVPYHMGFDICAETVMREREALLTQALAHDWILVFKHDPAVAAATVRKDEKGHFAVKEVVKF